jgi:RimJ/RimL family protein N-acetyltransferase
MEDVYEEVRAADQTFKVAIFACMNEQETEIITERLILRSLSPEAIAFLAKGNIDQAEMAEGIKLHPALGEHATAFEHDLSQLKANGEFRNWSTRTILLRNTGEMIGIFRFHSLPDPHYLRNYGPSLVEIGYVVFDKHRRKGFAEEMVKGIITWAKNYEVSGIVTSIAPGNIPSTKLITKMGFIKIGEAVDEVDGIEHIYLLNI